MSCRYPICLLCMFLVGEKICIVNILKNFIKSLYTANFNEDSKPWKFNSKENIQNYESHIYSSSTSSSIKNFYFDVGFLEEIQYWSFCFRVKWSYYKTCKTAIWLFCTFLIGRKICIENIHKDLSNSLFTASHYKDSKPWRVGSKQILQKSRELHLLEFCFQ